MKRWEYRNIHLLLAPVYLMMIPWCLRYRVSPFGLLKANYALDHGGATFASKYGIQMSFPQASFPATALLRGADDSEDRVTAILDFAADNGYPVVAKPDLGRIGYGVAMIHSEEDARTVVAATDADYMLQAFEPGPLEFGVFYVRSAAGPEIFAINSKEFPSVTGDGAHSVRALIERDPRLSQFQSLFNTQRHDEVPADGEAVRLSSVGSHTLGCIFRDATALRTPEMLEAIDAAVGIPGFNFGRLDVRTASIDAFRAGELKVIEVNGAESLATNAFDPEFSYWRGLGWFWRQFRLLVQIAAEHREEPMQLMPLRDFVRAVRQAETSIDGLGSMLHMTSAEPPSAEGR